MPEVPANRTRHDYTQLRNALIDGHFALFGEAPNEARLSVAWAQVAHETAAGQSVWNYNFGNLKCCSQACMKGRNWHRLLNVREDCVTFQAYGDATAGARSYWALLKNRYSDALEAFDAGDVDEAAKRLRAKGYYTQPLALYRQALRSHHRNYVAHFGAVPMTPIRRELGAARVVPLVLGVVGAGIGVAIQQSGRRRRNPAPPLLPLLLGGAAILGIGVAAAVAGGKKRAARDVAGDQAKRIMGEPFFRDAAAMFKELHERWVPYVLAEGETPLTPWPKDLRKKYARRRQLAEWILSKPANVSDYVLGPMNFTPQELTALQLKKAIGPGRYRDWYICFLQPQNATHAKTVAQPLGPLAYLCDGDMSGPSWVGVGGSPVKHLIRSGYYKGSKRTATGWA